MNSKEDEGFLKRLMATFKVEADEHLKAMSSLLLELEKSDSAERSAALVETLFREAHSLKGAARSVNLGDIETVCRSLESVLSELKQRRMAVSPTLFDVLYRSVDGLAAMLAPGDAKPAALTIKAAELSRALEAMQGNLSSATPAPAPIPRKAEGPVESAPAAPRPVAPVVPEQAEETVRISTAKLAGLLIQAEELLAFKFSAEHLFTGLRTLSDEVTTWKKAWEKTARGAKPIRRELEKLGDAALGAKTSRTMLRLLDAVGRDEFFPKAIEDCLAHLERNAAHDRRALSGMVDNLLEDMKHLLMLPFSSLLEGFPKLVRDLARDSGKEVELSIDGGSIEIDRRILEQMKNPLIHLIRNAIDHGIETPSERVRKRKPARGHIFIEIVPRDGNKIELTITDDGGGIDIEKVRSNALKQDLIPADAAAMTEQETFDLVFESGLSTSPILTDISGRGLGLAIVREKVERLDGSVTVTRAESGGTCFSIMLPATLATFRGLLVAVAGRKFVLPSRNVERVVRVPAENVKTVEGQETIALEDQPLSLVGLGSALGMPGAKGSGKGGEYLQVAVLASAGKRIAFAVDEVIADQEVLVKGLGPQLIRVPNIAAATVLGAGQVVPIVNVPDLMKSALKNVGSVMPDLQQETPRRSLLVVEDSITSRSLLRNILESANYNVTTAMDGVDALAELQSGEFDLVVSDVEMPRMDGFDLTAKIRTSQRFKELPVVLVTALDSREHKERGIEVGANAYIVKGSFDQSNLLEVIRRLT